MSEGISYRYGYGTEYDVANYWPSKKKQQSKEKCYERRKRRRSKNVSGQKAV